ncbi:MAG: hypothetical protein HLUCCA08_04220 [Rhodobacteraceae bacterium HLUCCA08]|nr:MAG: hypothetical protein HLUCCA08_04220 [Rhodobacteraceae bacterium HLUCCA08]
MEKPILAAAFALLSAPLAAQTLPEPGTVFVYDVIEIRDGQPEAPVRGEVTILGVDGAEVTQRICREGYCQATVQRDLMKYLGSLYGLDTEMSGLDRDAILNDPNTIGVVIGDEEGGGIFPLSDGKELIWTESWNSEAFNADYTMGLTQSCCVPADHRLARSEELWTFDYSFERTDGDELQEGETRILFDPELGWTVGTTTTSRVQIGDDVSNLILRMELREVIRP